MKVGPTVPFLCMLSFLMVPPHQGTQVVTVRGKEVLVSSDASWGTTLGDKRSSEWGKDALVRGRVQPWDPLPRQGVCTGTSGRTFGLMGG